MAGDGAAAWNIMFAGSAISIFLRCYLYVYSTLYVRFNRRCCKLRESFKKITSQLLALSRMRLHCHNPYIAQLCSDYVASPGTKYPQNLCSCYFIQVPCKINNTEDKNMDEIKRITLIKIGFITNYLISGSD